MGIELDWQVEADESQMSAQEDPQQKKKRRRERRNMILASLALAMCLCAAIVAAAWRLRTIEQRDKDDLTAAVESEFTALRIGNSSAYMNLQRSGSEPWLEGQRSQFEEYQTLKQTGRLSGDFEIVNIEIAGERSEKGRVIVQETIDGTPYQQVWFYWRYELQADEEEDSAQAGWRHVPPDVTFWGEEKTIENDHSSVVYKELDARMAEALAEKVEAWWVMGCALLACPTAPENLELIVDPEAGVERTWEPAEGWRLRVVSPYLNDRVPANADIPPVFEQEIATMIAERLLIHATSGVLQFPENEIVEYDTTWAKYELVDWLVSHFLGQESPFFDSIAQVFGETMPGNIARNISSNQQINQFAATLGAGNLQDIEIGRLGLIRWADFFIWRMLLERDRHLKQDWGNFFALYEGGEANPAAIARQADPVYAATPIETIQSVSFSFRADGTMAAVLSVVDANGASAQYQFMWNGDTFLRVN